MQNYNYPVQVSKWRPASVVTGKGCESYCLTEDDVTDSDSNEDIDSDHSSSYMIVTGSSTENSDSSNTSMASASTTNDRVVSVLDKLKSPTPADIARRMKLKQTLRQLQ